MALLLLHRAGRCSRRRRVLLKLKLLGLLRCQLRRLLLLLLLLGANSSGGYS